MTGERVRNLAESPPLTAEANSESSALIVYRLLPATAPASEGPVPVGVEDPDKGDFRLLKLFGNDSGLGVWNAAGIGDRSFMPGSVAEKIGLEADPGKGEAGVGKAIFVPSSITTGSSGIPAWEWGERSNTQFHLEGNVGVG